MGRKGREGRERGRERGEGGREGRGKGEGKGHSNPLKKVWLRAWDIK